MTASRPSRQRVSLAQLALLVPLVALVIDAWAPLRDNSFLWHIRAGELQSEALEVLQNDPFSFTMLGTPWLTQSWLAELAYAYGETVSDLGFVPLMLLGVSLITFAAIGLVVYQKSRSLSSTAIVLLMSTVLLISFIVPRPVLFSYALFAVVILAWVSPRFRWTLPLLFWIWASVHGSFAIGLAFVGLSLISERAWRWLPTIALSGLVTLATAHGLGVITMLLDFAEVGETLSLLSEWRRPELLSPVFLPFVIGIALIVVGSFRGRVEVRHLWVIAPFLLLGFSSTRAVPPAWLALVPYIAMSVGPIRFGVEKRFPASIGVVVGLSIVVLPFLLRGDGGLDDERFPVEAAAHLEDGNTFHDDRTGGYLIWLDGPERSVYLDDRAELYGERMAEFVAVRNLETPWAPVFERDGIDQVLLPVDEDLVLELTEAGWAVEFDDEQYVILR